MSQVCNLKLPAAVSVSRDVNLACIPIKSRFPFFRYVRNTQDRSYVFIGRNAENLVTCYVPLIDGDVSDLIRQLRTDLQGACKNGQYPFIMVLERACPERPTEVERAIFGVVMDADIQLEYVTNEGDFCIAPSMKPATPTVA